MQAIALAGLPQPINIKGELQWSNSFTPCADLQRWVVLTATFLPLKLALLMPETSIVCCPGVSR